MTRTAKNPHFPDACFLMATLVALGSTAEALADPVVPGFTVETYASWDDPVADPTELSFVRSGAHAGELFVGRDVGGMGEPDLKILRFPPGGTPVEHLPVVNYEFGDTAVNDPDAVIVDATGVFSGNPAGSVLVGCGYPGRVYAVSLADETTTLLWQSWSLTNPSKMALDYTGRLLIADPTAQKISVSDGGFPSELVPNAHAVFAIATDETRIFARSSGSDDRTIRVYDYDGNLLDDAFATGLGHPGYSTLAFSSGEYGSFETGLYTISGGELLRFDVVDGSPTYGEYTVVGTGFGHWPSDLEFGPGGALYVSMPPPEDSIIRIVPDCLLQYTESFSSEPGWITDQPSNYYWDAASETFSARTVNAQPGTPPTRYAYTLIDYDGGSFTLEYDMKPLSLQWSAAIMFGLFDESLSAWSAPPGAHQVSVWMGRVDQGRHLTLSAKGLSNVESAENLWNVISEGTWYHCILNYDSSLDDLQLTVTEKSTGAPVGSITVSNIGGLPGNLDYLGFVRDPSGSCCPPVGPGCSGYSCTTSASVLLDNVRFREDGTVDCNSNGVADECDIASGSSVDADSNGIPDECERFAFIDIKPGSCPNAFNRNSHGVLPVALLGTDGFDVADVDLSSIHLRRTDGVGGMVAPHEGPPGPHSTYEDVATPFEGETCDCHEMGGDGLMDLSMKFKTDDVVDALELGDLASGSLVELTVSGTLLDGTPFEASDCVWLVPPGAGPAQLNVSTRVNTDWAADSWVDLRPMDITLDTGGFNGFRRTYFETTVVTLTAPSVPMHDFEYWLIDGVAQTRGQETVQVVIEPGTHTAEAVYIPLLHMQPIRRAPTGPR